MQEAIGYESIPSLKELRLQQSQKQQSQEQQAPTEQTPETKSSDLGPLGEFVENNVTIPLRDAIDNTFQGDQLSREDIRSNRDEIRAEAQESSDAFQILLT